MYIDKQGWLCDVKHRHSPHCNARPDPDDISLIVVHNISLPPGEFNGPYIDDLFMGCLDVSQHPFFETIQGRVSAHCVIRRNGELIQYVSFQNRAWHAGVSEYQSRSNCNDFSIGIELEGTDDTEFTPQQYEKLTDLIQSLVKTYPRLSVEHITGHSDIAPGRKTDPGPCFDWGLLFSLLKSREKS